MTDVHVQQSEQDKLILSYLDHVEKLLRRYATSAGLDYSDLRQEASIVIMRCLKRLPNQAAQLHRYIYASVRNRMIDKIREAKRHETMSLDISLGDSQKGFTLADALPSGYSVDPLTVVLAKEAVHAFSPRRRKGQRAQNAIAVLEEVTA